MNCPNCGKANLRKEMTQIPGEVKGERFMVSMKGLACPKCGFTTVEGEDMSEYMRLVADAYRSKNGLLTSEDIRNRRSRLGMSQAEFATYLGVGVASVKRWELGKVQDGSSDALIRLRTDEEEARRNLERVREVEPSEGGVAESLEGTPEMRHICSQWLRFWAEQTSKPKRTRRQSPILWPFKSVPGLRGLGGVGTAAPRNTVEA